MEYYVTGGERVLVVSRLRWRGGYNDGGIKGMNGVDLEF